MHIRQIIDNTKIGKKFFLSFLIITILMLSVCGFGYLQTVQIVNNSETMYSEGTLPLLEISTIEVSLNSMRALVFRSLAVPEERSFDLDRLNKEIETINSQMQNFSAHSMDPHERATYETFVSQWKNYQTAAIEVFNLQEAGKIGDAQKSAASGGTHANARRATVDTFNQIKENLLIKADLYRAQSQNTAENLLSSLIIASLIVLTLSLTLATFITRGIVGPLNQVIGQFTSMSEGTINRRINMVRFDEIGELARMFDAFCEYLEYDIVNTMKKIAQGDVSMEISARGNQDQISPALYETIMSLRRVIAELGIMSDRASHGDLSVRGNTEGLDGSFREIIEKFNLTLNALVNPLDEAIRLSKEYSACNFKARFSDEIAIQGDLCAFRDAMDTIGREISVALSVIAVQMIELSTHAERASVGVDNVKSGAQLIASNADKTRMNAEHSEDGIAQVKRAMEDLTITVTSVAENIEVVSQAGYSADNLAKKGKLLASQAERGFEDIKETSHTAAIIITEVKEQMGEISRISGIITDISEQTNLLALNAAIEAARAGDAGRGFAVVAGEVKDLAMQTNKSAEMITSMIQILNKKTQNAVEAITQAKGAINDGGDAMHESVKVFQELSDSVEQISISMSSVAGATEEQAASFEEITASVTEMNDLVQKTAKDALSSSSTAEEALAVVSQITEIISDIHQVVETTAGEMNRFIIRKKDP
jgi:methyl-accepting chemotaxis protein